MWAVEGLSHLGNLMFHQITPHGLWYMSRCVVWWSCQSPVAHCCSLLNHLYSFHGGMLKFNTKFDAGLLLYSLIHFECNSHTVHMLTQQHLPPPLTSTGKFFTHAHSSSLSLATRLHQCYANCSLILIIAGLFLDQPHISIYGYDHYSLKCFIKSISNIYFSYISRYWLETSWVVLPLHSKCWVFFAFGKALIYEYLTTKWVTIKNSSLIQVLSNARAAIGSAVFTVSHVLCCNHVQV